MSDTSMLEDRCYGRDSQHKLHHLPHMQLMLRVQCNPKVRISERSPDDHIHQDRFQYLTHTIDDAARALWKHSVGIRSNPSWKFSVRQIDTRCDHSYVANIIVCS